MHYYQLERNEVGSLSAKKHSKRPRNKLPLQRYQHYDSTLPIKLAANASAYGVGVVISHRMPDQTERPIAFASRTVTASEKNYAQLEKEALSLVYKIK